jgi:hypothetical protein
VCAISLAFQVKWHFFKYQGIFIPEKRAQKSMDKVGWAAPGCDGLQSEVKYYQPALQNLLVKLDIQFCNLKSAMVNYLRSVGEREKARENGWPFKGPETFTTTLDESKSNEN